MSRILVTGAAGALGAAVVRRLLRDPDFEARVSDSRPLPQWIREGAAVHAGDLREEAETALRGCTRAIVLGDDAPPFTALERRVALLRAAAAAGLERVTFVDAGDAPLVAAHAEHGLPFTVCRTAGVYGPGLEGLVGTLLAASRARAPLPADADVVAAALYLDDAADAIVAATAAAETAGGTFAVSAGTPLRELAELCWAACGPAAHERVQAPPVEPVEEVPHAAALERALDWRPRVGVREGIARTLASLDHFPGGH